MSEFERWAAWYANTWVWEKPRPRSTTRTILLVVATGLLLLCAASITLALLVSTDLDNAPLKHDTDLQKKIYWHSSTKGLRYE